MPIMSTEGEKYGHIDAWHRAFKVQTEKFRRHRAERCVNAAMDGYEFPWRHETGDHTPNDQAYFARFLVKVRAILIREILHHHLLVNGFIGRWPDFRQARQGGFILSPCRFGRDEIVLRLLCLEQGNQLGDTNERGHFLGMMLHIEQPER